MTTPAPVLPHSAPALVTPRGSPGVPGTPYATLKPLISIGAVQELEERRTSDTRRVDLESHHLAIEPSDDFETLDAALSKLAVEHPRIAELIQLR